MALALIAVVDDDHSVRESLAGLIRSVGLAVRVYASAEDFLGSEFLGKTDCLILDVRMPGMDGLELQQRLRTTHPAIPVIFVTAHASDDETRSRAMTGGAVDYLLKPLSEEEVLSAVHTALKSN
jgi:FixJ family two-component response regulator